MDTEVHEIDGWKVRLSRREGDTLRFRAEARDDQWHRYAEAFSAQAYDALAKISNKTGIDLQLLLRTFSVSW